MKKLVLTLMVTLLMTAGATAGTKLTPDHPIFVDPSGHSVSFLAEVNGKYLYQPTRHFAVFKDGKNGEKAILRGLANHVDFYEALVAIKAVAGENMTLENKEATHVKGTAFSVTVSWDGLEKSRSIDEVVNDSNHTPIDMKFGGNLENAKQFNTGCLLCLDSCPVGIVSNAAYTYGAVTKRKQVAFVGNKDLLPEDGTRVVVTLTIK